MSLIFLMFLPSSDGAKEIKNINMITLPPSYQMMTLPKSDEKGAAREGGRPAVIPSDCA